MGEVLPFKKPARRPVAEVRAEHAEMLNEAHRNNWAIKCMSNPEPFVDYRQPPAAGEAARLCQGCPMVELCREFAAATKADGVIYGGIAWSDGKPVTRKGEVPLEDLGELVVVATLELEAA